jgi:hypothetical protein
VNSCQLGAMFSGANAFSSTPLLFSQMVSVDDFW